MQIFTIRLKKTKITILIFIFLIFINSQIFSNETSKEDNDILNSSIPFEFSFIYPIQYGKRTDNIKGLRINLLYGINNNIEGVDLGVIFNHTLGNFYGLQFGFLMNLTHRNSKIIGLQGSFISNIILEDNIVYGAQLSVLLNYIGKNSKIYGFQVSLITNIVLERSEVYGIQFAGIINYNQEGLLCYGFQFASILNLNLNNEDQKDFQFKGVQTSVIINLEIGNYGYFKGIQASSIANIHYESNISFKGIQASVYSNYFDSGGIFKGLQISNGSNYAKYMTGLQTSLNLINTYILINGSSDDNFLVKIPNASAKTNRIFYSVISVGINNTERMKGVQIGAVNIADKMKGVQLGLINYANNISGVQIGLINIIKYGQIPVLPILNISTNL